MAGQDEMTDGIGWAPRRAPAILPSTPSIPDASMYAAVDLGSNSFRLHIGEPIAGQIHIVRTARDPIRLAAGLGPDNALTEAAVETAVNTLRDFSAILRQYRLDAVRVVATNTMRVASNADAVLPRLEEAIGHPIEIISGEEEGRLIYMGVARAGAAARAAARDRYRRRFDGSHRRAG